MKTIFKLKLFDKINEIQVNLFYLAHRNLKLTTMIVNDKRYLKNEKKNNHAKNNQLFHTNWSH